MRILGYILACLVAPLVYTTSALAPALAAIARHEPIRGDFVLAAIVVSSGLIALLCIVWAAREHVRRLRLDAQAKVVAARAKSAQRFRDALIAASGQPVIVMSVDMSRPLSFAGGSETLKACLAGPDAKRLTKALDALLAEGAPFELGVIAADHRKIVARGTTVGGRVVVFFRNDTDRDRDAREALGEAEAKLQAHIEGLYDILDQLKTAIAAFGPDHRLVAFNRAFAALWPLPERWLRAHPTDAEILDRLRDERHLPEQRNFPAWRRSQEELFSSLRGSHQSLWHLPGGKSLDVRAERNVFGGLTFRFHDVSEQLTLESAYRELQQVQKAMLDTLQDGLVIIGPDGRVRQFNAPFARLWHLSDAELRACPHIRRVAELCSVRIGRDQTWEIIASGVAAAEPERLNDWGRVGRSDGKAIALNLSRLPDGATLVRFVDLTEARRREVMGPRITAA